MSETKAMPTRRFAREPQDHVGSPAPTASPTAGAHPKSKIAVVVSLLARTSGASLVELVAATGWQPHTTRAALTGLRKKGHDVTSVKADGVRTYQITTTRTGDPAPAVHDDIKLDA